MPDGLYLMSPDEIVLGALVGQASSLPDPSDESIGAREALERVIRAELQRTPCGVAFSGGRDSSLVLAVATHVARRDGLPEPIAVTRVFPGIAESDEQDWQELVVRHLGLAEWQRVEHGDELDVVGPHAARHLRAAGGVVWPPTIAADVPLLEAVRGGSMMDGEGGDEVLGFAAHRSAPLARLIRSPRPVRVQRVRWALRAVAPGVVRKRLARRAWDVESLTWLRPPAQEAFLRMLEQQELDRPLGFARSVRSMPGRRSNALSERNRDVLAAPYDVRFTSPLLHADVVHALAREGGFLGPGDRTAVLRRLAGDLLPDDVLARLTKAKFTIAYMGAATRRFAERWDGTGVDTSRVDPVELRRIWTGDRPNGLTAALLQSAWLATDGRPGSDIGSSRVRVADPEQH
jgi:asparagine synthase (glutamine-hydrolysing)